jgi:hypothetical protein
LTLHSTIRIISGITSNNLEYFGHFFSVAFLEASVFSLLVGRF